MARAQAAIPGMKVSIETDSVAKVTYGDGRARARARSVLVSFESGRVLAQVDEGVPTVIYGGSSFRTADEIVADMKKLHQEMCAFLKENRAANELEGLSLVGPAAIAIGEAVDDFKVDYNAIVYPGES